MKDRTMKWDKKGWTWEWRSDHLGRDSGFIFSKWGIVHITIDNLRLETSLEFIYQGIWHRRTFDTGATKLWAKQKAMNFVREIVVEEKPQKILKKTIKMACERLRDFKTVAVSGGFTIQGKNDLRWNVLIIKNSGENLFLWSASTGTKMDSGIIVDISSNQTFESERDAKINWEKFAKENNIINYEMGTGVLNEF